MPKLFTFFSSKRARLSLFAMTALIVLACSFVPVYAAEPAATGVSLTNHPGTGNVFPVSNALLPRLPPPSPQPRRY
jgi:hypothetical protein